MPRVEQRLHLLRLALVNHRPELLHQFADAPRTAVEEPDVVRVLPQMTACDFRACEVTLDVPDEPVARAAEAGLLKSTTSSFTPASSIVLPMSTVVRPS